MLGVNDKNWLVELLCDIASDCPQHETKSDSNKDGGLYSTYFGLGHCIKLHDRPGVFKVSLAGIALGSYLAKSLDHHDLNGRLLDVGTGSGVLALLLRNMGAHDVTGTDVSEEAVDLARENEALNFKNKRIRFHTSDLFAALPPGDRYDTIIFNPPGWRTPSEQLMGELHRIRDECDLAPATMFYGDQLLLRFLGDLPSHLHPKGCVLIGLNSLVGIQDVFAKYRSTYSAGEPLKFRLLERHSLPLLLYSPGWQRAEPYLRKEFKDWHDHYGAAYTVDSHGRLYWSYEVVECTRTQNTMV